MIDTNLVFMTCCHMPKNSDCPLIVPNLPFNSSSLYFRPAAKTRQDGQNMKHPGNIKRLLATGYIHMQIIPGGSRRLQCVLALLKLICNFPDLLPLQFCSHIGVDVHGNINRSVAKIALCHFGRDAPLQFSCCKRVPHCVGAERFH